MYIRRANLDSFWSRSSGTVKKELGNCKRDIKHISFLGLPGSYFDPGPAPPYDACGYQAAISMLVDSQQKGRYSESHKQYESVRKLRSTISNFERTSFGISGIAMVADDNSSTERFQQGGTSSFWFGRLNRGMAIRMGTDIRKNVAVSTATYAKFLKRIESRIRASTNDKDTARWIIGGFYFCVSYVSSLRGEEGFLLDIGKLREHSHRDDGLVWLPLVGTVKGDKGFHTYMLRSVPITGSGINVAGWRDMALRVHERYNRTDGPAICDGDGYLMTHRSMNLMLWEIMEELYLENPSDFPASIKDVDDIREKIQIFRSMRRTSDTQALRKGISQADINIVNRWADDVKKKKKSSAHLYITYAQQDLLNDVYKRYTSAQ